MHTLAVVALLAAAALACTDILVTPGASADHSSMVAYNADSHTLYGELYHWPHAHWPANSTLDCVDWDSQEYLGKIPQVPETYNVVGNVNEYQLVIGESTWGGLDALQHQSNAVIDYGTLIWTTLQRAKTAREAISVMTALVAEHGYASEGESFSIADPHEVWFMDLIGKGNFEKGAVWVAQRIPDGYISAHANQARITTFRRDDPDNCLFAPDVVSFARKHGFYPASASDADFSFSDVYNPLAFESARMSEARVWSVFRHAAGAAAMDPYADFALGRNLTHRLPLWVRPSHLLTVNETMMMMRDHFEGTPLDFRADLGAGEYGAPYRWRPLNFKVGGRLYFNERSISTQQTGWGFVAQLRSWMPRQYGAINWFSVDDTACTVYFPMYASSTRVPRAYRHRNGGMMNLKFDSAFWAFNLVSNYAYTRWSVIYPEVLAKITELEGRYFQEVAEIDAQAAKHFECSPESAVKFVTNYSVRTGNKLAADWLEFFKYLFTKYMDGNVKVPNPGHPLPTVQQPGYPQKWYERIVADTGDHYLEPDQKASARRGV
eukprot:m51a1_g2216 hypothetical protein (549) ;mRNA; f:210119-212261